MSIPIKLYEKTPLNAGKCRGVSPSGCASVFLPAVSRNATSLGTSEDLEIATACLTIPVVVAFTALSVTRLKGWRGGIRSHKAKAKRFVGSNVRRWEMEVDDDITQAKEWKESFQPSTVGWQFVCGVVVSFLSSAAVALTFWLGMCCIRTYDPNCLSCACLI